MNLSQVQVELDQKPEIDIHPKLRAEESRLIKITEALQAVQSSKEWSTLKTEVFENLVNILEKDLKIEAEKNDPSPLNLNRIAGELKWARKYSDLSKLEATYRIELLRVRQQLYGKSD